MCNSSSRKYKTPMQPCYTPRREGGRKEKKKEGRKGGREKEREGGKGEGRNKGRGERGKGEIKEGRKNQVSYLSIKFKSK